LAAFVALSAQEYGVEMGGEKGNVTLTSFDGVLRVTRARADEITFTEAVRVTRELVFRCIEKWTQGANANLARLVAKAFEADKNGHLSASKILSLRQIKIDGDPDWDAAMKALDGAIQVIGSRQYVRFYRRGTDDKYVQVGVDCAKAEMLNPEIRKEVIMPAVWKPAPKPPAPKADKPKAKPKAEPEAKK
jgi:hypothetical protein